MLFTIATRLRVFVLFDVDIEREKISACFALNIPHEPANLSGLAGFAAQHIAFALFEDKNVFDRIHRFLRER